MNIDQETDEIIEQLKVGRFDNGKMTKRVIKLLKAYKSMKGDFWDLVSGGEFYAWVIEAEKAKPMWLGSAKELCAARQHYPILKDEDKDEH